MNCEGCGKELIIVSFKVLTSKFMKKQENHIKSVRTTGPQNNTWTCDLSHTKQVSKSFKC